MTECEPDLTAQATACVAERRTLGRRRVGAGRASADLATTTAAPRAEPAEVRRMAIGLPVPQAPGIHEEENGAVPVVDVLERMMVTERRIIRLRRVARSGSIETTVALQEATAERLRPGPGNGAETPAHCGPGDHG